MTTLQNDLLEIYNSLLIFNKDTIVTQQPVPIKVSYEEKYGMLLFEQRGNSVRLQLPIYYCLAFETLANNPTYLLPKDYDELMASLSELLASGVLIEDRTCISPENYGFDVYSVNMKEFWKGTSRIGRIRFISGTSWLFKLITRRRYKL